MPIDREDVKLLVGVLENLCGGRVRLAAAARVNQSTLWRYQEDKATPLPATLERLAAAAAVPMWAIQGILLPAISLVRRLARGEGSAAAGAAGVADPLLTGEDDLEEALATAVRVAVAGFVASQDPSDDGGAAPPPGTERRSLLNPNPGSNDAPPLSVEVLEDVANLCARLCARSTRAAAHSAAEAMQQALLALRIAELVHEPIAWRSRLLGYIWAFVANAQRVSGDLATAEASFAAAWRLWRAGDADAGGADVGEWRLLDLEASLRRDRQQFAAAFKCLDRAVALAPVEAHGRIFLKRAATFEQAGDVATALDALTAAVPLVEAGGEPRDRWLLGFNLLVNLCHLGRHEEAAARLPALEALTRELNNQLDELRVVWLGGRVAAGLGRRGEARAAFEKSLRGFAVVGNDYDAALVGLELAVLHLEEGRTAEVRTLAAEMVGFFRSQAVHREAAAALSLFLRAAERDAATAGLARQIFLFLERARRNPNLRFEAAE